MEEAQKQWHSFLDRNQSIVIQVMEGITGYWNTCFFLRICHVTNGEGAEAVAFLSRQEPERHCTGDGSFSWSFEQVIFLAHLLHN